MSKGANGFTLLELAIMLVITGLIMVGGLEAIRVQTAKLKIEQAQVAMQEIQHALLGFVMVNGRLPYAANPSVFSGQEEVGHIGAGLLPWHTLGVKPVDTWGHAYTYHVTGSFAALGGLPTDPALLGDFVVKKADCSTNMLTGLPFIVVSHGPNAKGSYLKNGTQFPGATGIELDNSDDDTNYCLGSDDILMWISANLLKYQLL